ncbi:hypothetical protein EDD85DRAFT_1030152 [Armillaria nabsnona]|nr:hypothetical protein EDD85DRAFT_1030152 [Armillaria nabsnona]
MNGPLVVRAGLFALVMSLLLNILCMTMNVMSLRPIDLQKENITALPLRPRPAALTVEDSERYSLEDVKDWESIVPDGHGFVRLDDTFYAVSMYHQMHCLMSFRHLVLTSANNGTGLLMQLCGMSVSLSIIFAPNGAMSSGHHFGVGDFSTHNTDGRKTHAGAPYGVGGVVGKSGNT